MKVFTVKIANFLQTNAYFYIDEQTKHGFLFDPADEAQRLIDIITENHWTIEKILLTHGHFDHIGAVYELHKKLNIPYYAHENARSYLLDSEINLSSWNNHKIILPDAQYLKDNAIISLQPPAKTLLQVIYTPGHTQDSVIYYDAEANLAFVGDTIFKGSIGATHFPGGDMQQLQQSILSKIFTLPDDTILYSGHSDLTTVKAEKSRYGLL